MHDLLFAPEDGGGVSVVAQPGSPPRRVRRPSLRAAAGVALPLATLALLVVAWELATRIFDWPIWLVPGPDDVWQCAGREPVAPAASLRVTLVETLGGFVLAIAVGVPLAVAIASSRSSSGTIYPVLLGLNAVPKIAIAPILVLWMGFGYGPKIVVTFLLCLFPIVISTATGLEGDAAGARRARALARRVAARESSGGSASPGRCRISSSA